MQWTVNQFIFSGNGPKILRTRYTTSVWNDPTISSYGFSFLAYVLEILKSLCLWATITVDSHWVVSDCVCVGEWGGHDWCSTEVILLCARASSLVTGQRRSPAGCWPWQSPHSVAEQSTGTATRPHWKKLSNQAVVATATLLRATHVETVHSTRQQQHLSVQHALSATNRSLLRHGWLCSSTFQ